MFVAETSQVPWTRQIHAFEIMIIIIIIPMSNKRSIIKLMDGILFHHFYLG